MNLVIGPSPAHCPLSLPLLSPARAYGQRVCTSLGRRSSAVSADVNPVPADVASDSATVDEPPADLVPDSDPVPTTEDKPSDPVEHPDKSLVDKSLAVDPVKVADNSSGKSFAVDPVVDKSLHSVDIPAKTVSSNDVPMTVLSASTSPETARFRKAVDDFISVPKPCASDLDFRKGFAALRDATKKLNRSKFSKMTSTELINFVRDKLWSYECPLYYLELDSALLLCLNKLKKHQRVQPKCNFCLKKLCTTTFMK